jgi:cell division protein FtsQ
VSKSASIHPPARTWRDIPQQVRPRAMSRGGRRRRWFTRGRVIGAVLVVGLLLGGVFAFSELFQDDPAKISSAVNAVPVKTIELRTDGVLDRAWTQRMLNLSPKVTLMELDLLQLRSRLLSDPQVRSATVARKFPDTLEVTISERSPVALVNARLGDAAPRPFLVSRDGVVFAGSNFDSAVLQSLPWLDGIKLIRDGNHFLPVAGMSAVADLLATARNEAPHLYHAWRVVSLAQLDKEGEIIVHATNVEKIVFSTRSPDDFLHQLARLDVLIDTAQSRTDQPLQEINLAVGRMSDGRMQVPVTFVQPPSGKPAAPAARASSLSSPFFKPISRTDREL